MQIYAKKKSLVGVDPASIPHDQFDPECSQPIEATYVRSFLILNTVYFTGVPMMTFWVTPTWSIARA